MLRKLVFCCTLGFSPLAADPLECLSDGTVEQIRENLPNGSILYRDCYHCKEPGFEKIRVTGSELRPCHMHGSEGERSLYISGVVMERFQMPVCGKPESVKVSATVLKDELVVLNYAYLLNEKSGEARNIADMFGDNSHHRCKTFAVRKNSPAPANNKPPVR